MGVALHRLFPFVDYVCSGEADLTFPPLAEAVLQGRPVGPIPGVTRRVDGRTMPPRTAGAPVADMDALPVPDYGDFVEQLAATALPDREHLHLLIETARGCWWGQKSHCTFCGLNGSTMQFRAKSAERAVAEFTELAERYGPSVLAAVDNIIDMRYFRDVLPALAALKLPVQLFYETKSNLRKEQVRLLSEAGIVHIQPGIESLSTNVLRLMGKGVTALQNIQLLRWCAEFLVQPGWNILGGFPGEDPADYARQAALVPLLTHLPPPQSVAPIRLDRFSPLFVHAGANGIRNVRAARAYEFVYPFAAEDLAGLAAYFDFDYADGRDPIEYMATLRREVEAWSDPANIGQLVSLVEGEELVIRDTRPVAVQKEHHLRDGRRVIYEYCDQAHTRAEIAAHLAGQPGAATAADDLDAALVELVAAKLMLHADGRYLSLAVNGEYRREFLLRQLGGLMAAPPGPAPVGA
jgi:ribosomal peptide maturation radical SAM protein 1